MITGRTVLKKYRNRWRAKQGGCWYKYVKTDLYRLARLRIIGYLRYFHPCANPYKSVYFVDTAPFFRRERTEERYSSFSESSITLIFCNTSSKSAFSLSTFRFSSVSRLLPFLEVEVRKPRLFSYV